MTWIDIDRASRHLVSASKDKTARVWDAATGALVATLSSSPPQPVDAARFSPDGQLVITAAEDKSAVIWTLDGRAVHILEGHSDAIPSAAFSPDGRLVATGSDDGTAKVWDVASGSLLWSSGHSVDRVWSVMFSPDGRFLLAAQGPTARVWAMDPDDRDPRDLEAFAACRIELTLANGRLERVHRDYLACHP